MPGSTVSDPLGRVQKTIDGDSITAYEYPLAGGVRMIRAGLNGDPLAVSSSVIVTDALGHVVSATPDQAAGASATYSWDVNGELARADVSGLVGGATVTQVRT